MAFGYKVTPKLLASGSRDRTGRSFTTMSAISGKADAGELTICFKAKSFLRR